MEKQPKQTPIEPNKETPSAPNAERVNEHARRRRGPYGPIRPSRGRRDPRGGDPSQ